MSADPLAELGRLAVPAWHDRAACRAPSVDSDWFFASRGENGTTRRAKRVCADCPVRGECLDDALKRGEKFGVWGGLSERERRRLRRQRRSAAA